MTTTAAAIRTRAYSNPTGQRRIRATSPGQQTSYAWNHALDAEENHRSAAEAHGIQRHGMTSGARGEDGRYVGAAGAMEWTVTDYADDDDERHPDDDGDHAEDPYGLDEDIPGFLARYAE